MTSKNETSYAGNWECPDCKVKRPMSERKCQCGNIWPHEDKNEPSAELPEWFNKYFYDTYESIWGTHGHVRGCGGAEGTYKRCRGAAYLIYLKGKDEQLANEPEAIEININDACHIKLTDYGLTVLSAVDPNVLSARVANKIELEALLWELMVVFGTFSGIGSKPLFVNNIIKVMPMAKEGGTK